MIISKRWAIRAGFICLTGVALFLTFNRHSKSGYFNYHSEIWVDKAGYYVYLPAALKYGFNPDRFPDSIDYRTGLGFRLDHEHGKVLTKYTYGVALMQLPFFLFADIMAKPLDFKPDGFSPIYHWSLNVASVFYLVIGFFFLGKYLRFHFSDKIITLVLLTLFLATHLYYYSIDETGMSHVYSFSLFSVFLYLLEKTGFLKNTEILERVIFGIICGLIVLIRPSNVLFLTAYLFLDSGSFLIIIERIKRFFNVHIFFPVCIGGLLIVVPQFVYWHYASGSPFIYSYGSEGFNWTSPKTLQTWFSPDNGLFLYVPIFILIVASLILMIRSRKENGWYLLGLFLVLSYLFSSWYEWDFGCSFGARSFVEYLAILSIPVAILYQKASEAGTRKKLAVGLLILVFAIYNLKMTYSYDGCFQGSKNWDWKAYARHLTSPTK